MGIASRQLTAQGNVGLCPLEWFLWGTGIVTEAGIYRICAYNNTLLHSVQFSKVFQFS